MTDSSDALSDQSGVPGDAVTRQVRATSAAQRPSTSFTPAESSVITAELPIQRASSAPLVRRSFEPVNTRRLPAPAALQVVVWLLALIFLIVVIGTIVALASPDSMSFLRNSSPSALHAISSAARRALQ